MLHCRGHLHNRHLALILSLFKIIFIVSVTVYTVTALSLQARLLNDALNLVFYAHKVSSAQDSAHDNDGACLGEFIAVFSERVGLDHHAPSGAILGSHLVVLFVVASDIVVLRFHIEHNLVFSKVTFLGQLGDLICLGTIHNSNSTFVVEIQEFKGLEGLLNGRAFEKDLAVEARQYFANKDLVHKVGHLYIVEEVEKLLVVSV